MAKQQETRRKGGLILVIGFIVVILLLIASGYHEQAAFNPPNLRLILNFIFISVTNVFVAIISARSFLRYGQISFALLSGALVISGLAAFFSGLGTGISNNASFTIFNVGFLTSSVMQAFGAVYLSAAPISKMTSNRKVIITLILFGSAVFIALLTIIAASGLTSPFVTPKGTTALRQFVVGLSLLFFILASALFGYQYLRSKAPALYWYSLALALFAIDTFVAYNTAQLSDLLQWIGRIADYVGGLYFIAVLLALRQHVEDGTDFSKRWFETFSNNRSQFAALFANMLSGFAYLRVIADKNGNPIDAVFLGVNEEFERDTGLKRQDVIGKRMTQVIPVIEEDPAGWINIFGHVALKGEPAKIENYMAGLRRWFRVSAYSPEVGYVAVLFEDVTERKRLQTSLEEYTKNLEQLVDERTKQLRDAERLATIGQIAGMVGHDIRNPLQAIVSELYFARQQMADLSEGKVKQGALESMDIIQEQVDYINKIVSDLQDYAKPLKPELIEVDICKLIPETIKTVNIPNNIQTDITCEEHMPPIRLDPIFMRRILTNLTTNAVQAMPDGGKLTIKASKKGNQAVITVEDTGVGILEEVKPKLFTPLFTTKAKGQGFGLSVVKRLVEAQGGTITFESQQGIGTKFIVALPTK